LELARAGKIRSPAGCDDLDGCSSGRTKRDRAIAISHDARAANMRSLAGERLGAKLPRVCVQISRDPKHPSFAFVHDRDFRCSPDQPVRAEAAWNVLGELRARRSLDVDEDLRLQRINHREPVAAQPEDMTRPGPISPRPYLNDAQSA